MKRNFLIDNLPSLTFLLVILYIIISCIYNFGTGEPALHTTANLKIDTRGASIDDVLGGIRIKPVKAGKSTTSIVTSVTSSKNCATASSTCKSAYSLATSSPYITEQNEQDAKDAMKRLKENLSSVKSNSTTSKDFNLAGVFYVNDFLELGVGGFRCYSNEQSTVGINISTSEGVDKCPINGFLQCLGKTPRYHSNSYKQPYEKINKEYLLIKTGLSSKEISEIDNDYHTIVRFSQYYSLTMNIPVDRVDKLGCGTTKRRSGNATSASSVFIFGVLSISFTGATLLVCMAILKFFFWLLGFGFLMAQTGVVFHTFIETQKELKNSSVRSSISGALGFLSSLLVIQVILGSFYIYRIYVLYQWKKSLLVQRRQEYYESGQYYQSKEMAYTQPRNTGAVRSASHYPNTSYYNPNYIICLHPTRDECTNVDGDGDEFHGYFGEGKYGGSDYIAYGRSDGSWSGDGGNGDGGCGGGDGGGDGGCGGGDGGGGGGGD